MKVNFRAILHSHASPPPFLEIMILPCSPCCFLTLAFGPESPPGGCAVQGYDQQVVLVLFFSSGSRSIRSAEGQLCTKEASATIAVTVGN